MKKKKSFVTLALIVAVLILGVGYAISNVDLSVNGDVKVSPDDNNFKVVFTDASIEGTGNTATVGTGTEATLHVETLTSVGDTATATYTITNQSQAGINASLSNPAVTYTEDAANGYYEVTAALADATAIAPNGTKTLTVTVKLVKAPVKEITGNFKVSFTATPQQAA